MRRGCAGGEGWALNPLSDEIEHQGRNGTGAKVPSIYLGSSMFPAMTGKGYSDIMPDYGRGSQFSGEGWGCGVLGCVVGAQFFFGQRCKFNEYVCVIFFCNLCVVFVIKLF